MGCPQGPPSRSPAVPAPKGSVAPACPRVPASQGPAPAPGPRDLDLAVRREAAGWAREEGWVLESIVWNMDQGKGQLLTVESQPERTGIMSSTTRKVGRKSPGHHGSKSLLCGIKEVGLPLQTPSLPNDFSLCRYWEGHPSEQARPPLKSRPPLTLAPGT